MAYTPSRSPILKAWKTFGNTGPGRWLVSKAVSLMAPYFRTIKPKIVALEPGYVEVHFKKRWGVTNHIKTVHAIAMCNAAELAGGVCADISLSAEYRWIPVGMEVKYLKMAKTDLRAICQVKDFKDWDEGDIVTPVAVYDKNNVEVFHADITMRVSKKQKS